jgi:hypothetical protein
VWNNSSAAYGVRQVWIGPYWDSKGNYAVDLQQRGWLAAEVGETLTERHLATYWVEVSRNGSDGLTLLLTTENAPGWLVKPSNSCVSAGFRMEHCGAGQGMELEHVLSAIAPCLIDSHRSSDRMLFHGKSPSPSGLEDRSAI